MTPPIESDGARCGRRAGEKLRRAIEEGRPLDRVIAFWPDFEKMSELAEQMAEDDRAWWLDYLAAFETAFPTHREHA